MQTAGIKSQFLKRVALESNLPPDMNSTIKDLLIKEQSDSATVYSDCKKRLLKIYGSSSEASVAKAQTS